MHEAEGMAEEIFDDPAFRGTFGREHAVVTDDGEPRAVDAAARELFDHRGDFGQEPRFPRIVGVQQGDVFARGLGDAVVAGHADPGVGLCDEPHERRGDLPHDLRASVGRSVVHDDDLQGRIALRQRRTHGGGDFALLVVEGYDDRNRGF